MEFSARFNSFLRNRTIPEAFALLEGVGGLNYVDLNYAEHFCGCKERVCGALAKSRLRLHAINMRYRDCAFLTGVLGNGDEEIVDRAVRQTLRGIGMCRRLGGRQAVLWLSHDGYDYPFQLDYGRAWERMAAALKKSAPTRTCP